MSALRTTVAVCAVAAFAFAMRGWGEDASVTPIGSALTMGVKPALGASAELLADPASTRIAQAFSPPASPAAPAPSPGTAPPAPTTAQAPAASAAPAPAGAAAPADAPPAIDLTALRYFAQQGDTRRLEAEIARLKALYPNWQPPENPLEAASSAPQGDPELDRIWQLYAQGQFAQAREAIAARTQSQPNWQPPADLIERLNVAEARLQLVNASNLQQYQTVIRLAADTPSLLTCSEVDVLWRVARAFAETGRPERAKDAYLYVLTNCNDAGERLATMQMATQRLKRPDLDALLATERTGPDGVGEFTSVRADLARASLVSAADDASVTVAPADLELIRRLADATDGQASDDELLGWYAYRRNDEANALKSFTRARERADSATISQGYALSLISAGRFAEAEAAMADYRTTSDGAKAVYLAAAANLLAASAGQTLDPAVLTRIVGAVGEGRDAASAQQLGWYAYGLNQFQTAGQWFATALGWKSDDEQSAYGLALVRQRVGETVGLSALQRQWAARSPRIAAIGRPDQAEVAAAQAAREGNGGPPPAIASSPAVAAVAVAPAALPSSTAAFAPVQPAIPASSPATAAIYDETPEPRAETAPAVRRAAARPARSAAPAQGGGGGGQRGCAGQVEPSTLSPDASMARGWCLLNLNRSLEAAAAFESAARRGNGRTRQDSAYGESLAYLRLGVSDRAAIAASRAPQPVQRRNELNIAILSARATSAFEAKRPVEALQALDERARIAPERLDLMVLRGYAYLELRRYADAERVFSAVSRSGSSEGARGLTALNQALGRYPN
ncbi:cellulose synthase [Aureimonas sp. ME7]|uniref:cellulose synthase n=1 Tax=Aureimonas sp. ME7 TaxID=2744252 RepID=UPI001FCEEE4D|nr:cellulose synthase [Aureimonas sp. ME7]